MERINNKYDNSPNLLERHRQRCSTMTTREKVIVRLSVVSEAKKHGIRAVLFELFCRRALPTNFARAAVVDVSSARSSIDG
jgi:hypothetical protein